MILAIDCGNTRVKWALFDNVSWLQSDVILTKDISQLQARLADIAEPDAVFVSNVAGAAVQASLSLALAPWENITHYIKAKSHQCGVQNSYLDPAQLGSDRWAALIAAWNKLGEQCVVVNAGTAVTIDALSNDGVFLGGLIIPGIQLMHKALAFGTDLPKYQSGRYVTFSNNTADAISSGAIHAICGTVQRVSAALCASDPASVKVVLSGGDATLFQPLLANVTLIENLVLEGIIKIANSQNDTWRS